jgi:hypothetical protein
MSEYDDYRREQAARALAPGSFPAATQAEQHADDGHGHHEEVYHGIRLGHHYQYPHVHVFEKTWKIVLKTLAVLVVFTTLAFLVAFVDMWTPSGGSVVRVIIAWVMGISAFFALIGIWFVRSWLARIILGFIFGMGMYLLWWFVLWHTLVP